MVRSSNCDTLLQYTRLICLFTVSKCHSVRLCKQGLVKKRILQMFSVECLHTSDEPHIIENVRHESITYIIDELLFALLQQLH